MRLDGDAVSMGGQGMLILYRSFMGSIYACHEGRRAARLFLNRGEGGGLLTVDTRVRISSMFKNIPTRCVAVGLVLPCIVGTEVWHENQS